MKTRLMRLCAVGLATSLVLAAVLGGAFAAGIAGTPPVCDVKVNGSDTYITVPAGPNNVTVDWNLTANDWAGSDCDVFLLLMRLENLRPVGVWSLVNGTPSIVNGIHPYMTGPLTDMSGSITLTIPPNILKKVWLAVDDNPNGVPDRQTMIYDYVIFKAL